MALTKYNATVNGHKTVLQLNEKDARARGLGEKDIFKPGKAPAAGKAAAAPANKAAAPAGDKTADKPADK
ncbi:hypothetical protein FDI29_gp08 [Arthrobacter phage Abidatro]|uniref:Uncharacterized protein n=1 Tax=Arthrobacter phage Abidatro TaxID=2015853 RepID=A0A222ZFH6_9CAUD|nr:hypothetical protein FDI29_gp08 [Arthrobacter phage Abidatro]ASR83178.1 hypothetical protein SEA_ABIDATRO_8 [Arthrobacter phage Abidatro]